MLIKNLILKLKSHASIILISLFFLLQLLVIWKNVNFHNSDDFIYRLQVSNFLKGNFRLDQIIATTFYAQGLLGFLWVLIFGMNSLNILTLLVSYFCVISFYKIVRDHYFSNSIVALVITLFLALNPLFLFSSIGFMTDNYFLLPTLLGLNYFLLFDAKGKTRNLIIAILFFGIAFFVKQIGLSYLIALPLYLGFKFVKEKQKITVINLKPFLMAFGSMLFFLIYYFYFFPKTPEMVGYAITPVQLLDINRTALYVSGFFIYVGSLIFPILLLTFLVLFKPNSLVQIKKNQGFLFGLIILVAVYLLYIFKTNLLPQSSYPYFPDIFSSSGLYTKGIQGIQGIHYKFDGYHKIFLALHLFSRFSLFIFSCLILFVILIKKHFSYSLLVLAVYFAVLVVTPVMRDRYLLPMFPIAILFCLDLISKCDIEEFKVVTKNLFISGFFVLYLVVYGYLGYQYFMDYIFLNKQVLQISEQLVLQGVDPQTIKSSNSWRWENRNRQKAYFYAVMYDKPEKVPVTYRLINSTKISFPLSFWQQPYVYTYHVE